MCTVPRRLQPAQQRFVRTPDSADPLLAYAQNHLWHHVGKAHFRTRSHTASTPEEQLPAARAADLAELTAACQLVRTQVCILSIRQRAVRARSEPSVTPHGRGALQCTQLHHFKAPCCKHG